MTRERKIELVANSMVWLVIILGPVLYNVILTYTRPEEHFSWAENLHAILSISPILILFIIHDIFLAPIMIRKHNTALYLTLTIAALAILAIVVFVVKPAMLGPYPDGPGMGGPGGPGPGPAGPPPDNITKYKPVSPDYFKFLFVIAAIIVNLAVKSYFKNMEDNRKVETLEKENLRQQLGLLRYQINPHFFMNTLNNIHALVDINPHQAQESIVELSKMMRYILYEGDKVYIPLAKEVEFIEQYVSLMKIRCKDTLDIDLQLPDESQRADVPPMVFVSFVENAFKHGVSYIKESFIKIYMGVEGDKLKFSCKNSLNSSSKDEGDSTGIGLTNIKSRLDLFYGDNYTMDINETESTYEVSVAIPRVMSEEFKEISLKK